MRFCPVYRAHQPQLQAPSGFREDIFHLSSCLLLLQRADRFWAEERPGEELYDLQADPHEIRNLADRPEFSEELGRHRRILEEWIRSTDDKGQYPEDAAGLRYMFDWWGDKCVNPEYDRFRK